VVLAQVTLPTATATPLAQSQIDSITFRRRLFSTATIQDQVRLCCCAGADRAPARVTSVNPPSGAVFTNASTVPSSVNLTFSKNLQPATVNTNTIQVLRIVPGQPSVLLQGTVVYDDGLRSATFTPAQAFTIPALYQITVVGSGPSAILDSDNLALDGNDDGQPGGNFISTFTVSGPGPTPTPTPTPTPSPSPTPTPTPTPTPSVGPPTLLIGTVVSSTPPTVPAINPATVGNLVLVFTGGTPGQQTIATITVSLSAPIGNTPANDTAQLITPQGNSIPGLKASPNSNQYTFQNVAVTGLGGTNTQSFTVSNMKVDASQAGGGGTAPGQIQAFVTIPQIPLQNQQALVAFVG
jgi:hypothetical protein